MMENTYDSLIQWRLTQEIMNNNQTDNIKLRMLICLAIIQQYDTRKSAEKIIKK